MRTWLCKAMASLLVVILSACGDPDGDAGSSSGTGAGSSSGTGAAGGGGSAGTGGGAGAGGGSGQGEVPTSGAELFMYLKGGGYLAYPAESVIHDSTGPHGGKVRTYITPSLEASLKAGGAAHPIHAAAIKELYKSGDTVSGWAVMVKTQTASDGGQGWYRYEIYSSTDPGSPVADGNGVPLCYNCHASGKDFFRSPFPLQ